MIVSYDTLTSSPRDYDLKYLSTTSPWFLIVLALLAALPPFAIDTYTPAVPLMAQFFHESEGHVIWSISSYLLGFGLGMLVWGPLSDVVGRKVIIRIGLIIYMVATLSSTFCTHLNALITWRFFQAIGDSAGVGVAFTMLRDCYSGQHLTRTIASIIAMMMLAPMIAPLIGSCLLQDQHWQNIFYFLFSYGCVMFVVVLWLPETLSINQRVRFSSIIKQYQLHLKNRQFLTLSLCASCSFAATFCYISTAALIYMSIYHIGKFTYSGLFAINAISIIIGSLTLRYLSSKKTPHFIQCLGLWIFSISDIAMIIAMHFFPDLWLAFTIFITIATFGLCLLIGSFMSSAMNVVHEAFGTATSILNALRNILGSVLSMIVSSLIVTTIIPLPITQLCLASILFFMIYFIGPSRSLAD